MGTVTAGARRWGGRARRPGRTLVLAGVMAAAAGATAPARAQTSEGLKLPPQGAQPPAQIEAQKLSKVPKQIKFVEADYPKEASEQGIESDVVLLLDIDATGKITAVGVNEPAKPPGLGFDEAAVIAAWQFEFEPAEVDGKPIAVQLTYRYRFRLKPPEAPPAAPPTPTPGGAPPLPAPAPAARARTPVVNLSGLVRERGTRLPLAGVLVTVFRDAPAAPAAPAAGADAPAPPAAPAAEPAKAEGYESTADAEGRFQFFDLAPGEWKILIEPPGYYPFRTTETVAPGEGLTVTYYVERGSYNPFDVTVTATRPRKEVSRTVLSSKEIEKVPGAMGDPIAVVQNFAGVARMPVAGLLVVRGSAPEDTKVYVDGIEVPLIYHFGGLRSVIPAGMLENIEFYPGNFAPGYGRATGGIIDVQVKKLEPAKVGGYADVSLLDTGVYLEAPLGKKGAFAVAGRRSYIDYIINAVVPADAPVSLLTAPRYYDMQLLGNYRPTAAHDLRAFFFGSDDRLKLLFSNPADADPGLSSATASTSTSFYRSLLSYRYVPGGRFENQLRLSQGRDWLKARIGQLILDVNIYSSQIRDTARHRLLDSLSLSYGLDFLFSRTDFLVQLPLPTKEGQPQANTDLSMVRRSQGQGQTLWRPAGFAELDWRPLPDLLLLPGVRVDYLDITGQTIAQPRLTARWQLHEVFTAKGGAGLFVQEPDVTQGENDPVFGNPALRAERARHYSFGFEWKPLPHLTLDLTGFYKDLRRLISRTEDIDTVDGMPRPLIYDNRGRGRVYGMELVARHDFANNFTGWLAYTLSRSLRTDSNATRERLFDFDQTHILTAVASYLLPRNWQVGGRFRLVSGNPRTPVVGSVFNASSDRYDPIFGEVNSARNGPFHQLDLRVDKRWVYQGWMLSVYLDMQNVYNRANPEGIAYNYSYDLSRAQGGLPILTILGIRGEF
jgi:TonB family protein